MTVTFITGANKGLGRETARQLIALGHTVLIGARDQERGSAAARDLGARFVRIDVSDDESVRAAARDILEHEGGIDVLINNAGIPGPRVTSMAEVTTAAMNDVLQTNVLGTVRTMQAFLPMLERSAGPIVVNVSSSMGSFARATDPQTLEHANPLPFYQPSKAALNMLTVKYAEALPQMRVNAADPGPTDTDINDHQGYLTVAEGAESIVTLATVAKDGPTGIFLSREGIVPW